ncbi:MAG: hypothetical protein GTO14_20110, partial [Anaerolineales bacterium]|nr:hypothetical protein [Anaerolineales bacterium]
MAKKKEKKKKKKLSKRLKKLNFERIMLIVVTVALIIVVAVIAISSLGKSRDEGPSVAGPVEGEEGVGEQLSPGEEATPTPRRLEVHPSPTAIELLDEDDPRSILNLNIPYASDSFDGKTWGEHDHANATYDLEDGHLLGIDHEPEERFIYWSLYTEYAPADPYAEVSATNGDCVAKDSVGFVIRVQADETPSGYALEISCDGSYRFRNHHGSKAADELIPWTPSDVINTGANATNRIGLWGYKAKFHLFINGQQVAEFYDPFIKHTYGYFGVYVRASNTFDLTA